MKTILPNCAAHLIYYLRMLSERLNIENSVPTGNGKVNGKFFKPEKKKKGLNIANPNAAKPQGAVENTFKKQYRLVDCEIEKYVPSSENGMFSRYIRLNLDVSDVLLLCEPADHLFSDVARISCSIRPCRLQIYREGKSPLLMQVIWCITILLHFFPHCLLLNK